MLSFFRTWLATNGREGRGDRGERLAAEWLERERRFSVVVRNWRSPRDRREEIDLVCRDGEVMVFVEVKARAAGALVPGYHAVDERKKRVLRRAIEAYLGQLREKPPTFRFDVVEVSLPGAAKTSGDVAAAKATAEATDRDGDGSGSEILHFENVPLFSKYFRG